MKPRSAAGAEAAARWPRVLALGATAAILTATVWWVGPRALAARLGALDPAWLGVTLALAGPLYLILAARWWFTANRAGAPLGFGRATAEYFLSTFLNQALPLGVAGDAVRAVRHGRRRTAAGDAGAAGRAIRVVLLERLSGLCGLGLVIAIAAATLAGDQPRLAAVGALEVAVIAGAVVVVYLGRQRRLGPQVAALGAEAQRALLGPALPVQLGLSLAAVALLVAMFHAAGRAAGVALDLGATAQVVPIILGVSMLPLAFAGWGVREAVTAAIYGGLGLDPAAGVAVAVTFGAASLVASAPGLVVALVPRGTSRPFDRDRAGALGHAAVVSVAAAVALATSPTWIGALGVASLVVFRVGVAHRGGPGQLATVANALTALRLVAVAALPWVAPGLGEVPLAAAAAALYALDGLDGWVARRHRATALGAELDMECDALFVLALCLILHDRGAVGSWVAIAGFWRYGYAALVALVPGSGEAPRSGQGRLIAGALMIALIAALALPPAGASAVAAAGVALVSYSFGRGLYYTYRAPRRAA